MRIRFRLHHVLIIVAAFAAFFVLQPWYPPPERRVIQRLQSLSVGDIQAVPYAVRQLRSANAMVRFHAANALARIGADAEVTVPTLIEAMQTDGPRVAARAVNALGEIQSPEAIDVLIDALEDERWEVRLRAAEALSKFGHDASEAVPNLRAMLHDPGTASMAAIALGSIGEPSVVAVEDLCALLTSANEADRAFSIRALSQLSFFCELPGNVLPEVARLTKDESEFVRLEAEAAMSLLSP